MKSLRVPQAVHHHIHFLAPELRLDALDLRLGVEHAVVA
jgi:hypothetical protein